MYVLIMIVLLSGNSVNLNHLYYEDGLSCQKAAAQFEAQAGKDLSFKAFCIRGDQE